MPLPRYHWIEGFVLGTIFGGFCGFGVTAALAFLFRGFAHV